MFRTSPDLTSLLFVPVAWYGHCLLLLNLPILAMEPSHPMEFAWIYKFPSLPEAWLGFSKAITVCCMQIYAEFVVGVKVCMLYKEHSIILGLRFSTEPRRPFFTLHPGASSWRETCKRLQQQSREVLQWYMWLVLPFLIHIQHGRSFRLDTNAAVTFENIGPTCRISTTLGPLMAFGQKAHIKWSAGGGTLPYPARLASCLGTISASERHSIALSLRTRFTGRAQVNLHLKP